MKFIGKILFVVCALMIISGSVRAAFNSRDTKDEPAKVVVAYVTSWKTDMPDPSLVTHINYAFGGVNPTFDGVDIDNGPRFAEIVALKCLNPDLKVLLSIGGWGSGRFSEMAADETLRTSFAKSCAAIINKYGIDGIDIDWEYPGSDAAGISSSENDTENFTLLMRDIRHAIGDDKLLTFASAASADYVDFPKVMPYVDFVNLMTYDMAHAPKHQAALYPSGISPALTCDSSVKAHIAAGVPADKVVLGLPFYGRGPVGHGTSYRDISIPEGCTVVFDTTAMVPYIADAEGTMIFGFDNPRSLKAKCDYVNRHNLRGAMYWEYNGDNDRKELATTVFSTIFPR